MAARLVQLANFVSPTSGGIRTALAQLRAGYVRAGVDPVLVIPGPRDRVTTTAAGRVVELAAPPLPGSGGYRILLDLDRVRGVLADLRADRVEVSDRFTLRAVGAWAQESGVPSTVIVHERLDKLLEFRLPWLLRPAPVVRRDNARLAAAFDQVVVPSAWAAAEFGTATNLNIVGWGVDVERFRPDRRSAVLRRRLLEGASVLISMVCRLSPEKQPLLALDLLRAARSRGIHARLVIAGTGAYMGRMRRSAAGLPVTFLGHLEGRDHVAELLASADLNLCPGPLETFGLAALEALACGTPVITVDSGAVPELLRPAYGRSVYPYGPSAAAALEELLDAAGAARDAARAAAEEHDWSRPVNAMLAVHRIDALPVGP